MMQKKFIKAAGLIIVLAMIITVAIVFCFQTISSYRSAAEELEYLLDEVEIRLGENTEEIEQLKDSLGEDYLARARAFSYMIQGDPSILNSAERLAEITGLLDVDELHVTDGNGVIRWGTVPDYFGFDMAGSGQTLEFMPILQDSSMELAQEPQPNGAGNIMYQYIGVARRDMPGIVQIGMQPTRLDTALKSNEIGVVLERYLDDEEGIFAINSADGTVAWHPTESLIGATAQEIGLKSGVQDLVGTYSNGTVNGQRLRLSARTIGDYTIVAYMVQSQLMAARNMQLILLLISDALVVLVMVMAISRLLKKQIVAPIQQIAQKLKLLEEGELDTQVDIRTCNEFAMLSNGINAMVEAIGKKMTEAQALLEHQQAASIQMGSIAEKLRALSDGNLSTADRLYNGAAEQTTAIRHLTESIDLLAEQLEADSKKAALAGQTTTMTGESLHQGMAELDQLAAVMQELNQMSTEIQKIIKAIDDIAFQTNILALNAAVEAARAGSAGKGFAVVADEVRELASKSADSAKQTADMIGHTIDIMQSGESVSIRASQMIREAIDRAGQANELTGQIVEASVRQNQTVLEIRSSGEQVEQVIRSNAAMAEETKEGATQLLDEVRDLQALADGNAEIMKRI